MIEELKNLIKNLIREDAEKNAQSPGKNENNIENIAQSIIDAIRKNVKTDNIMATINDFFSSNSEKGGSTTFNSIVNDATQSIVKQIDVAEDAAKGFIERLLQKLSLYIKSIIEDPKNHHTLEILKSFIGGNAEPVIAKVKEMFDKHK